MISKQLKSTALALLLMAHPALAAEEAPYSFSPESAVTYVVTHPMHRVEGVSHQLIGALKVIGGSAPQLALPLRLSIPIASFSSGNRNRDRNMLQTMNAARYPEAVIALNSAAWSSRRTEGSKAFAEGTAQGVLTLHGVSRPVDVQLSGSSDASHLEVDARFSFLLTEFEVDRPSLMFRPIDDQVTIAVKAIAQRP